jgi:transposase-like protein
MRGKYGDNATPEQIIAITQLAKSGSTAHIIARKLGVSASKIRRWLDQNQITVTPSTIMQARVLNAKEQAEFRTYYKTMPSQKAIFAKYQISAKTLRTWLAQMNLDPIPPRARPQTTNRPADSQWCATQTHPTGLITQLGSSIADRFRAQGLATIHPDRY